MWADMWALEDMVEERSEEHTSELQSPVQLVCRLLLEKKKPDTLLPRAAIADGASHIVNAQHRVRSSTRPASDDQGETATPQRRHEVIVRSLQVNDVIRFSEFFC